MWHKLLIAAVSAWAQAGGTGEIPWPEHPRPDLTRAPWVNLNGPWRFAFDPADEGEKARWFARSADGFDRRIAVPFPWESRLSGVGDPAYRGVAWYARQVAMPEGAGWDGKDVWLVVGACDFEAKVWVNGQPAGGHVGGYVPFDVNLSRLAAPGQKATIIIRAVDRTDEEQPIGKQVERWYTRTSGIWQTVYLEPRPKAFIRSLRARPDARAGTVLYEVALSGPARLHNVVVASADGQFDPVGAYLVHEQAAVQTLVKVREPRPWSPDSPVLYPVAVRLVDPAGEVVDEVQSYFGLREVSAAPADGSGVPMIHLNGRPIYLRGALHQSFHPDGIYQYPDDAAVRADYELCRRLGLNFLRIHIKVPTPRELYWADRLGVLVMADMPSFWKFTPAARAWWQEMAEAAIERDFNHPAVFSWCLFNETWGIGRDGYGPDRQAWVAAMVERARRLDPTRLVEDNSPCRYDHVMTDINSWHFYMNDDARARDHVAEVVEKTYAGSAFNYVEPYRQDADPLINSEYGGIGAGAGDQDVSWCFKFLTNTLRRHAKIGGYVYTELSDIEWEHNGFVNYDRSPKEFAYAFWHPGMTVADLNGADFVALDAPPMIELAPHQDREVGVRVSHTSEWKAKELQVRWRTDWLDRFGRRFASPWRSQPAQWRAFDAIDQPAIRVAADHPTGALGALLVELADGDRVLARNYVNLLVDRGAAARVEAMDGTTVDLRAAPADYAAWTLAGPLPMGEGVAAQRVAGRGAGAVEYRLRVPENLRLGGVTAMTVLAELASSAGDAKLDWPARRNDLDDPQTDGRKWPSDVVLELNGREAARMTLPDDPADAAGALSHHRGFRGTHGELVACDVPEPVLKQVLSDLARERVLRLRWRVPSDARHAGGLSVYGEPLGAYPLGPTVRFVATDGHGLGERFASVEPVAVDRVLDGRQVLIATAEAGGHEWRYTTDPPGDGWEKPDYDDAAWKKGKSDFGSKDASGAAIGTAWTTADLWLRTEVAIDAAGAVLGGQWRVRHDEDVEIHLNGRPVLSRQGLSKQYVDVGWEADTLAAVRPGRNVVAVHCRNASGAQVVDVGATIVPSPGGARAD